MNGDITFLIYFFNPTKIYLISPCVDIVLGIRWDMNEFKEINADHKSLGMKTTRPAQRN